MRGIAFVLALINFGIVVQAQNTNSAFKSAHRKGNESYLKHKNRLSAFEAVRPKLQSARSAADVATYYGKAVLPAVVPWESKAVMQKRFEKMRDFRWMTTEDHPGFARRPSWLYPDDGCYARAALAIVDFFNWNIPIPNKIFAFGDLTVNTPNAPEGSVSWWYHVAPIVQVANEKYVLDPSIEPRSPLKLENWLRAMNPSLETVEVAICESASYIPDDPCAKIGLGSEPMATAEPPATVETMPAAAAVAMAATMAMATADEKSYLELEWERLLDLNRSPNIELGDKPPWL